MKRTSNIEHPTPNIQSVRRVKHGVLDVRCWMSGVLNLLLFACLGGGFVAHLSASEPSSVSLADLPTPTTGVAGVSAVAPAPRQRAFAETDLLELLTATLQQDYVKDKGEVELRLTRPWTSRMVPDEPLSLKVLDLPATGVSTSF